MQSKAGAFGGKDVKGFDEICSTSDESAVIQEENEEQERRTILFYPVQKWLKDEGEEERCEGVSLLSAGGG